MNKAEVAARKLGDEGKTTGGIFDRAGKQVGVSGAAIKAGVGVAALAAGTALVKFGADGVRAASNLEQSVGAVESVFGSASGKIFAFGETAANAAGLSKREVNEMASVVGAQLQGMGLSANRSADEVIKLERRAADMAATFGGPTKQALEAISATLRGERDPIERYGVSLKDTDIQARILALGLDTSTVAAKKQAVAVASLDLIMSGTAQTSGQFARESDSLAGSQARLKANTENLKAAVGTGLTPAIADLADTANDAVGPLTSLLNLMNQKGLTKGIIDAVSVMNPVLALGQLKGAIDDVTGASSKAAPAAKALVAETTSLAEKSKLAAEAEKDAASALDKVKSAQIAAFDSSRAYAKAQDDVRAAGLRVVQAQTSLNALLKAGAVDAKAVASATKDLEGANKTLASAQKSAADAQTKLNKALAPASERGTKDANLDLRDAVLDVDEANVRLVESNKALKEAQEAGIPTDIAAATRDFTQAEIDLERAQLRHKDAQQALVDLDPTSEAGALRVADAERGVADANDSVALAQQGVIDKTAALNEAQAGDLDFTKKVWAAKLDLLSAQNGVKDAQVNAAASAVKLTDAMYTQAVVTGANADAVGRLHDNLGLLAAKYPQFASIFAAMLGGSGGTVSTFLPNGSPLNAPGRRASGGPVSAGGAYVVGENGPEVLTMGGKGGYVHANGGGGGTVNVFMAPGADGDDVVAAIRRYEQRNGPGWRN